jgi:hypothetical protein
MKHSIASTITGLASLAFVFPLSFMPDAPEKCADPSYHFVTSDHLGSTVKDMTNAKTSFCRVVADNVAL